jgi:hypothetical protein
MLYVMPEVNQVWQRKGRISTDRIVETKAGSWSGITYAVFVSGIEVDQDLLNEEWTLVRG